MRTSALIGALLIAGVIVGRAHSQTPGQQPQFRAGVDLVQIDVVALDKDGHPVRGLTAADFTLVDQKKVQQIATFKEVTIPGDGAQPAVGSVLARPSLKLDVVSNQIPPADRLLVIVLDDFNTFQRRSDLVKTIAHKVANALGPQSSIAILFTSGRPGTEFSRDPSDIASAIDSFKGLRPVRRPSPGSDDERIPGKRDPLAPPPPYDERKDLSLFYDDLSLPNTIGVAANLLRGAESGRKAFVLISESTANNLRGMFQGRVLPCEFNSKSPCYYQRALEQAVENLERANITLYAFDPRGAVADSDVPLECTPGLPSRSGPDPCVGRPQQPENNWIRYAQQGLAITTEAAGGFAVTNSDDFDGGIARLLNEIDHYYLLGFSPADRTARGFRPVTVTVNRPGVTLHYRRGYVLQAADTKTPETSDPLVAMTASILPRADLPLRLTATTMSVAPDATPRKPLSRVVAWLEVTLPRTEVTDLRYSLLAANLDTSKVEVDIENSATITSGPARGTTAMTGVKVQIPIELRLPPGRYQLRASALSATREKGGSVYLVTEVPDLGSGKLVLGTPLLGATGTVALAQSPSVGDLPFTPTLDRSFDATDVLRVYCPLAAHPGVTPTATVELMTGNDLVAGSAKPDVNTTDRHAIEADVSLGGLEPGTYRLRIRVADGIDKAERVVPIVVK